MKQVVSSARNLTKIWVGKTTMFKLLVGLLRPSVGTADVLGLDSVRDNGAILRHTGSLTETPVFYEHLLAADNLQLHPPCAGTEEADIEPVPCRVGLPGTGDQLVINLVILASLVCQTVSAAMTFLPLLWIVLRLTGIFSVLAVMDLFRRTEQMEVS